VLASAAEASASATGVAQKLLPNTIDDGLPDCWTGLERLPSGVPVGGHERLIEVLQEVSGAWRVTETEPRYERPPAPPGTNNLFVRVKEAIAWRRQRRAEQYTGSTVMRAADVIPLGMPLARIA
jgi:hypothetical protein